MTLPLLAVGAVGLIGVATHWCTPDVVAMFDAWEAGDVATPARSTPGCSPAGPSRPATRPRTRARPRRCSPPRPAGGSLPPADGGRPRWLADRAAQVWDDLGRARLMAASPHRLPRRPGGDRAQCMAIEQGVGDDRRIVLIDCGLMFPGPDLHGIDLVLPDFTYLIENASRIDGLVATHGHEDHVGGIQFLLREISLPVYGSALTLGLARNRIEEAGLLGRTELRAGGRRRTGPRRSVRRRVRAGHPQRPPRPRRRRAHEPGRDPPLRRLQARPDAGRRPPHRPRPHRPAGQDRRHPGPVVRLDERRGGGLRAERAPGRRRAAGRCSPSTAIAGSSPPASPATSTASSRSPMPPSPTAARWPRSA